MTIGLIKKYRTGKSASEDTHNRQQKSQRLRNTESQQNQKIFTRDSQQCFWSMADGIRNWENEYWESAKTMNCQKGLEVCKKNRKTQSLKGTDKMTEEKKSTEA